MRIFRISSWEGQAGGAQLYMKTVDRLLENKGHKTQILNIVSEEPDSHLVQGKVINIGNSFFRTKLNFFPDHKFISLMKETYYEFRPDIISIHSFGSPFLQIGEFVKMVNVPIVFHAHDSLLVCPINTLTRPESLRCEGGVKIRCFFTGCNVGLKLGYDLFKTVYFDREVQGKISAFICPSLSLTEYLHNLGYRPAIHLPSFVEDPAKIPENIISKQLVIGYIGRLEYQKGVQYLIRSFHNLSTEFNGIKLVIAGKGSYENQLTLLANELGISDRVEFIGNVSGREKEEFFARSNIIVVPSATWENHPLSAIEAQLRKRPVIGTDFGGIKEIVEDGKTGYIVPIADVDSLSKALRNMITNKELIVEMGERSRARALMKFTPSQHLKGLLSIYERVINREKLDSPLDMTL